MKVKAANEKLVVIDLEAKNPADNELAEHTFDGEIMLPRILRVFEDHVEIRVSVCGKSRKTLKVYFNDAILMNRTLHRICGRKKPK
jgi:hypothetical protein